MKNPDGFRRIVQQLRLQQDLQRIIAERDELRRKLNEALAELATMRTLQRESQRRAAWTEDD